MTTTGEAHVAASLQALDAAWYERVLRDGDFPASA